MSVRILTGHVLDRLAELPDASAQCVVTSPPYWGLRDYGVVGQIGLEPDFREYIATMVAVFREVRRVLRADGTLWLNLGDSYATGAGRAFSPGGGPQGEQYRATGAQVPDNKNPDSGIPIYQPNRMPQPGLKPKDLCGIPWRVAFALQEDGWWLRQDIIWSKPNPMPESVRDRCTKAHEYLFLLSKSERYHFDQDAIKEQAIGPAGGNIKPLKSFEHDPVKHRTKAGIAACQAKARANGGFETRNRRSVWEIATQPFSEAHFATFPPALVEPCILAGCPEGGTVLDPFGGSGTVGLVADRLNRAAILIELNPDYAAMARRRIEADAGMFAEVAE